jgi:HEAT repeat protein
MDDVAWSGLKHNYGNASDVPDLLRGCQSSDADMVGNALLKLFDNLYHQGGWVCSAAAAALPFLVDLAAGGAVHHRHEVVGLIGMLAREAVTAESRFVDSAWQPALDATRSRLLALLDDPDPRVRREATFLVADGIRHPESVQALRRRWGMETDRTTRCDLVLAFGTVCAWRQDESLHDELVALLDDNDLQVRLAAVHALAESDRAVAARHVDTLVQAVRDPDTAVWQGSAWMGGTRATIVHTTGNLLTTDPIAATVFAIGVSADSGADLDRRVATLGHVQQVLSEWRTVTGTILPFLADHLDDDVPEVRYRATALLACLGLAAKPYTDRLVARTADPGRRDSREAITVGDAAVWALARQDDPRCLPGLLERLSGDRLGFETAAIYFGRDMPVVEQPGIHEILIPLRRHADTLLGAITARIMSARRDRVLVSNLLEVIAAWGTAAEAAIPVVAGLLQDDEVLPQAAEALGAIGPAAADAALALRRRIAEPAAAWALWRTGADPDRGAESLIRHIAEHRVPHTAIALLADLGPHAAASVEVLREVARSDEDWMRVEAAHALWRITGDPAEPVTILTELAQPLTHGQCLPARIAALGHLAEIGAATEPVTSLARTITDNPRRIAYFGGWRTFTEDEEIRTAASWLLG